MPVPKSLKGLIGLKNNKIFLRRLTRLPVGCSKAERVKVLNKGDKKMRMLLIHILHQVMAGEIPLRKQDHSALMNSGKVDYLNEHFQDLDNVKRLLRAADSEQKEVLSGVNNYHILLSHLWFL